MLGAKTAGCTARTVRLRPLSVVLGVGCPRKSSGGGGWRAEQGGGRRGWEEPRAEEEAPPFLQDPVVPSPQAGLALAGPLLIVRPFSIRAPLGLSVDRFRRCNDTSPSYHIGSTAGTAGRARRRLVVQSITPDTARDTPLAGCAAACRRRGAERAKSRDERAQPVCTYSRDICTRRVEAKNAVSGITAATMQREPTHGRVPQDDGSSKSLIMSVGKKKIHGGGPDGLGRMMYQSMTINGVQYCRRHLVLSCHLCQLEYTPLKDEVDIERQSLGLRDGGDPMLNERSEEWREYIQGKQMESQLGIDLLNHKYGKDHAKTHPQHGMQFMNQMKEGEREINGRFLSEVDKVKKQGATRCCYWACNTPSGLGEGETLLRCTGCGIAKYCCKEHHRLDWKWEHKGECTVNLPGWLNAEMEQDRVRNMNGDYADYKS